MPVFWGVVPNERPVHRELLVGLQRTVGPDAWRRPVGPFVRAGVSGRGNNLLVLAWTTEMLAVERSAGVRMLHRAGIVPGQRVANNLPGSLSTPGSLLLGDVVEELGALDVPLGETKTPATTAQAWELIERLTPQALVLEAVTAEQLFAGTPAGFQAHLEVLVWLHREPPLRLSTPPPFWNVERQLHWLTVPEVLSFFAYSCSGDHFHSDESLSIRVVDKRSFRPAPVGSLLVEWLDPDQGLFSYFVPWLVEACSEKCSGRLGFRIVGDPS